QQREPGVVGLADGPTRPMLVDRADLEILVVAAEAFAIPVLADLPCRHRHGGDLLHFEEWPRPGTLPGRADPCQAGSGAVGRPWDDGPLPQRRASPHLGRETMETGVRTLFERYERVFNRSLGGDIDMDEGASLY